MGRGEIITVAVGQCGNQLSRVFWELAELERAQCSQEKYSDYDECSLFRTSALSNSTNIHRTLKARSILVDTEPAVINETVRSPILRKLYQAEQQTLLRYSGSGNNFARGFFQYGEELSDSLMELLQHQLESCDSLQGICVFHSLGGGTGSGLGTKFVATMADALPKKLRLTASVLPSQSSQDVVTSPYNVILSLAQLTEHADLVLPIDNSKLAHLAIDANKCFRLHNRNRKSLNGYIGSTTVPLTTKVNGILNTTSTRIKESHNEGFKSMNMAAARILIDMTAGTRFNGDDCTRINDIAEFICDARRHYITSSVSCTTDSRGIRQESQLMKSLFGDTLKRSNIIVGHSKDIRWRPTLGTTLICRGLGRNSDLGTYMKHWKSIMRVETERTVCGHACGQLLHYNLPSILSLSNSSVITDTLQAVEETFKPLYQRKALLHHYSEFCDLEVFEEARMSLKRLQEEYQSI